MKKLLAVLAVCFTFSGPLFAAQHVVTHSAKVAGKASYKVTKYTVKGTAKTLKFLF